MINWGRKNHILSSIITDNKKNIMHETLTIILYMENKNYFLYKNTYAYFMLNNKGLWLLIYMNNLL